MRQSLIIYIFIFCSSFCISNASAAKIYKWTDEDGQTHFSQTPPSTLSKEYDVRFAKEKSSPEPKSTKENKSAETDDDTKSSKPKKPDTPQDRMAAIEKERSDAAKKAKEEKEKLAAKKEKCGKAQKKLRSISHGGRIYEVDEAGERKYWDDATRASKLSETQSIVDELCG